MLLLHGGVLYGPGVSWGSFFFALSCYCFFGVLNIAKLSFFGGELSHPPFPLDLLFLGEKSNKNNFFFGVVTRSLKPISNNMACCCFMGAFSMVRECPGGAFFLHYLAIVFLVF